MLTFTFAVLQTAAFASADPPEPADTGFVRHSFSDADSEHGYVVYVPASYTAAERWPVILYLHGAGTCGTDGERHLTDGLAPVIRHRGDFPAIVVFPQCEDCDTPILQRWLAGSADARRALRALADVEQRYSVDPHRRVLAGWSMGGYGAWSLAAAHPDKWAAVVAVSGGGTPDDAARIVAPVWAIHGELDRAIPPERSREMVEAAQQAGGKATLTILPGISHDAWRYAFSAQAVQDWMLTGGQTPADSERLVHEAEVIADTGVADALSGEFRTAMIIPRAVSVRLGNDALRALAYGLPEEIDPALLRGQLDDLHFAFTAAGERYEITQSDVRFEATLKRIILEAVDGGLLRVQVGLQPLRIDIGSTRILGTTRRAEAGPVSVSLGHRYPLWIDLKLRPRVSAGRLRLAISGINFEIPDANWVVTAPEQVSVEGPDLTPELVRTALVGGLYTRRADIEQYIRDFLPDIVRRVEDQIQPDRVDRVVSRVWPLPVFQPRLRLQPEEVATDQDGLSLVLALHAAPFEDSRHVDEPVVTQPMGPRAADVPRSRALAIGIAPDVLQALSAMAVEAHAARIDVRDMPDPSFAALGERSTLASVLPAVADLPADVELRTEFDLAAPFVVHRPDSAGDVQFASTAGRQDQGDHDSLASLRTAADEAARLGAQFEIPKLLVKVFYREPDAQDWKPYARFEVSLSQSALVCLAKAAPDRQIARLNWAGEPVVEVHGGYVDDAANDRAPVNRERLAELISDSWQTWITGRKQIEHEVPDLTVGSARLRLETIAWRDSEIIARFDAPATRIINTSQRLVEYEVRGQYSNWSRRYQLPPGESHVYDTPSALFVRRYPRGLTENTRVPPGGVLDLGAL